ncbi:MAG: lytic transglycosylase domain-containing protein [Bdellovibrionota bacterium]
MRHLKKTGILSALAAGVLFLILFQNMSLVEFAALNIAGVDESARRGQARELLGDHYDGSFAQKLEDQEYLNYLVYQKLQKALGAKWEQRLPDLTRVLIHDARASRFDPVFILAIIQTESSFNPNAIGGAGEIGLMQIKPATAEWIANKEGIEWLGKDSLFDPMINIRIGIRYFAYLRSSFDHSANHYVSAYNMGPGNVRKLERNVASTGVDLRLIKPEYASRVLKNYNQIYDQMSREQFDLQKFALFRESSRPRRTDTSLGL